MFESVEIMQKTWMALDCVCARHAHSVAALRLINHAGACPGRAGQHALASAAVRPPRSSPSAVLNRATEARLPTCAVTRRPHKIPLYKMLEDGPLLNLILNRKPSTLKTATP